MALLSGGNEGGPTADIAPETVNNVLINWTCNKIYNSVTRKRLMD